MVSLNKSYLKSQQKKAENAHFPHLRIMPTHQCGSIAIQNIVAPAKTNIYRMDLLRFAIKSCCPIVKLTLFFYCQFNSQLVYRIRQTNLATKQPWIEIESLQLSRKHFTKS